MTCEYSWPYRSIPLEGLAMLTKQADACGLHVCLDTGTIRE